MNLKHGSLESVILNSLWELEKCGIYKNSVKDVFEYINNSSSAKRAYTTIKTVMDRLVSKSILVRYKVGKKFFYRVTMDKREMALDMLNEFTNNFFNT